MCRIKLGLLDKKWQQFHSKVFVYLKIFVSHIVLKLKLNWLLICEYLSGAQNSPRKIKSEID